MNLLETLLSSQGGGLVTQIAKNFGLDENAAKNVIAQVVPAMSRGIQKNSSNEQGLEDLLGALNKGKHERYLDNPEVLAEPAAAEEGNSILGHIFGNKDVSRNVAGHAAQQTGISSGIIKKILPIVAAAAMGALTKKSAAGGLLGAALGAGGGSKAIGMLSSFLDADKDGSIADDLLNLARKFF